MRLTNCRPNWLRFLRQSQVPKNLPRKSLNTGKFRFFCLVPCTRGLRSLAKGVYFYGP